MVTEAYKLARATLRMAVRDYGWTRKNSKWRTYYGYGPGKFEGEHWSIVHWYDAYMNGCTGDESGNNWEAYEVTDDERAAFGIKGKFVVLSFSDQGFVSLSEADDEDTERLHKSELVNLTAPSHWASYLINGDASGLEDDEQAQCDAWIESVGLGAPVSCEDAGFIHHHDAYNVMPLGADCQTYTFYPSGD